MTRLPSRGESGFHGRGLCRAWWRQGCVVYISTGGHGTASSEFVHVLTHDPCQFSASFAQVARLLLKLPLPLLGRRPSSRCGPGHPRVVVEGVQQVRLSITDQSHYPHGHDEPQGDTHDDRHTLSRVLLRSAACHRLKRKS